MKILQVVFALLFAISPASASIVISEIMYNPNQGSDTDLEWIEIYNNGISAVDLSSWKVDDSNFDDVTINPGEYIVIARELIDGTDEDNESFEWHYGNNDGIWDSSDGNYKAVDGSFSLTDDDFVVLSDGVYQDAVNYSSSWGGYGNGKSIYKINLDGGDDRANWDESIFDGGTPGKNKNNNGILVSLQVVGGLTEIKTISLPDDLSDEGYQIFPVANSNRLLELSVDAESQSSSLNAYAELNGNKIELSQIALNGTTRTFAGNLEMQFYDGAGNYSINVSVTDANKETVYKIVVFEYMPLMSSVFDVEQLNFGNVSAGSQSSEKIVIMKNAGNVMIDLSASATDMASGSNLILANNLQMDVGSGYNQMSKIPAVFDLNLGIGVNSNKQIYFKVNVPGEASSSLYYGIISLNAIEG